MKSRFLVLFICLLATVSMIGCDFFDSDDDDDVITSYGSLKVSVTSSDGVPTPTFKVANTAVTAEKQADGSYLINNIAIGEKVRLDVEATGYVTAYAFENITTGNTTIANVTMISEAKLEKSTAIDLTAGAAVATFLNVPEVKIEFPKDSVKTVSGKPVTNLEVKIAYQEPPTASADLAIFPGNFAGIPTGETLPEPFITYGFIYVDLGMTDGEKNELKDIATLTMKAPAAGSPAEMPLWSYDETTGVWKQEGVAKLGDDGFYKASVSHFSWYNLDAPVTVDRLDVVVSSYTSELNEWAILEGTTTDPDRSDLTKRVVGATVVVSASSAAAGEGWEGTQPGGADTYAWQERKVTSSSGVASFNIPKDKKFSIDVITSTKSKSGYMYKVENGVATAYVNLGAFTGEFDQGAIVTPENDDR